MRNLSTPMISAITSASFVPVFLVTITFRSETVYVWNGPGNFTYGGHTYLGVGSLGKCSGVTEGVEVKADSTSLTLSGIDPVMFGEAMTDIQVGAPAIVLFGAMNTATMQLVGTPYQLFAGQVGKPHVDVGVDTISITLNLENKMIQLQRPTNRRYTAADQNLQYSDDSGFDWVEVLNDIALIILAPLMQQCITEELCELRGSLEQVILIQAA